MNFSLISRVLTRLLSHSKSNTLRDSLFIFVAVIITSISGFFITVLLAHFFSPEEYGLYITATSFAIVISDLFELGLRPAILNFISGTTHKAHLHILLKLTFILATIIALVTSISIIVGTNLIATLILNNKQITPFVIYTSIYTLLIFFIFWGQAVFQATKRFMHVSIVMSLINGSKLIVIGSILLLGYRNMSLLYLFAQIGLLVPIAFIISNQRFNFLSSKITLAKTKEVLQYSIPIGLSSSLIILYSRIDQIVIFHISGKTQAGLYGLAYQLTTVFISIALAIGSAIIPRYVYKQKETFLNYFKKTFLLILGAAIVTAFSIILAPIFIPLLFGAKFAASISIYQILIIGTFFYIVSLPFNLGITYQYKKTAFILTVSLVSLLLNIILLFTLVPALHAIGGAISISITYFVQSLIFISAFLYFSRRNDSIKK